MPPAATCTFCSRMAADDIARGQIARRDLVRIQPDAHGVIAGTEHLDIARARECAPAHPSPAAWRNCADKLHRSGRSGENKCTTIVRSGDCLIVVTPRRRTSSGNFGSACETRFCTCTCALSTSVPSLKVTVKRHDAVARRLGEHVKRVLDAVDGLFQRRGDRLGNRFRDLRPDRRRAPRRSAARLPDTR